MTPAAPETVAIGPVSLDPPFGVAPMAGMTDTAFRRLVKRHGGCGLVVTEMVSSEGLVRGHRSDARVRRVHRRGAARLDPDLRRRPGAHGRSGARGRGHGRRRRRHQHGVPGPEDREAQRRVLPHARARARRAHRRRDGEGGAHPGDGEDARRLERPADQRARARQAWWRTRALPPSPCTAGPRRSRTPARRTGTSSRASRTRWRSRSLAAGIASSPGRCWRASRSASTACWWAGACSATRGSSRSRSTCSRVDPPVPSPRACAASSCSSTSTCCCASASTKRPGSATPRPARIRPRHRRPPAGASAG